MLKLDITLVAMVHIVVAQYDSMYCMLTIHFQISAHFVARATEAEGVRLVERVA